MSNKNQRTGFTPQADRRILEARLERARRLFDQRIEIETLALQTQLSRFDAS
jgi:hypothetical protein